MKVSYCFLFFLNSVTCMQMSSVVTETEWPPNKMSSFIDALITREYMLEQIPGELVIKFHDYEWPAIIHTSFKKEAFKKLLKESIAFNSSHTPQNCPKILIHQQIMENENATIHQEEIKRLFLDFYKDFSMNIDLAILEKQLSATPHENQTKSQELIKTFIQHREYYKAALATDEIELINETKKLAMGGSVLNVLELIENTREIARQNRHNNRIFNFLNCQ